MIPWQYIVFDAVWVIKPHSEFESNIGQKPGFGGDMSLNSSVLVPVLKGLSINLGVIECSSPVFKSLYLDHELSFFKTTNQVFLEEFSFYTKYQMQHICSGHSFLWPGSWPLPDQRGLDSSLAFNLSCLQASDSTECSVVLCLSPALLRCACNYLSTMIP